MVPILFQKVSGSNAGSVTLQQQPARLYHCKKGKGVHVIENIQQVNNSRHYQVARTVTGAGSAVAAANVNVRQQYYIYRLDGLSEQRQAWHVIP